MNSPVGKFSILIILPSQECRIKLSDCGVLQQCILGPVVCFCAKLGHKSLMSFFEMLSWLHLSGLESNRTPQGSKFTIFFGV